MVSIEVVIVSRTSLPLWVRYSCVTVSVEASVQSDWDKSCSSISGSSAGAAFGSIGSHGSSSREIKISGNRSFVWFKGNFLSVVCGADLLKMKVSSLAALLSTHRFLAPIMYQFTVFRIGFFQLNVFYVELLVLKNIFQL